MDGNSINILLKGPHYDIELILGNIEYEFIGDCMGAFVIPFQEKGFLMVYHKKRKSWEFPGGKRENRETLRECIFRETIEEAGVTLKNLVLIGYYLVKDPEGHRKAAIYMADVESFSDRPDWSEMGEVKVFKQLPENLSYRDGVYEAVLKYIQESFNPTL